MLYADKGKMRDVIARLRAAIAREAERRLSERSAAFESVDVDKRWF